LFFLKIFQNVAVVTCAKEGIGA